MLRGPVSPVDQARLQLAETCGNAAAIATYATREAGALHECLQGCLAYAGCVEICTVHIHIIPAVHRTASVVACVVWPRNLEGTRWRLRFQPQHVNGRGLLARAAARARVATRAWQIQGLNRKSASSLGSPHARVRG